MVALRQQSAACRRLSTICLEPPPVAAAPASAGGLALAGLAGIAVGAFGKRLIAGSANTTADSNSSVGIGLGAPIPTNSKETFGIPMGPDGAGTHKVHRWICVELIVSELHRVPRPKNNSAGGAISRRV